MKILLINDYAAPLAGAELQLLHLREALRNRGYDARLFSTSASNDGTADYVTFGTTSRLRTLLQSANPMAYFKLRSILSEFRPDVVHATIFLTQLSPLILPALKNYSALYYAVWYRAVCPLGTKMLPDAAQCEKRAGAVCYHSGCLPLRDWIPLSLQMKMWRRWRQKAFKIFAANSQAVKQQLQADGIENVEVIWPGVKRISERSAMFDRPLAVFSGRLVPEKGAELLIRAFEAAVHLVPEAQLWIAGDGPQRAALQQLVGELKLGGNIQLLGQLTTDELQKRFSPAWVQVVPSRWPEPFGLAAAEAMMRSTAVIASATGGLLEIVQHQTTGLLIPPSNVKALSQALVSVLGNCALAEKMGKAGREYAMKNLTEEESVDRFVALYKRLAQMK
jgi:glycosyltransferase involved in cell wall biosynthesis